MTARACFHAVFILLLSFAGTPPSHATGLPPSEKARIESLISHVRKLENATFIRNGKEYDAATAAKFLRGKWKANRRKIDSAEDFIKEAATKSSTTGKPYLIRFKDGEVVRCGKHLRAELRKIQ